MRLTTQEWRVAVEALTSFHRQATAARYVLRGTARVEVVDAHGEVREADAAVRPWHAQRVRGQAERFQNVAECGGLKFGLETENGLIPLQKRCDCWRVCSRCMRIRRRKLGAGMKRQRMHIVQKHKREIGRFYKGREGRWSEKLITFTVPHSDSPAEDARLIVDAWQKLLRKIRAHLQRRGAVRRTRKGKLAPISVPWCRALEVSPREAGGHAHMHVWWYGPFLDHVLLRHWWGEIVAMMGREVPSLAWQDVRATGRDSRLAGWLGNPREDSEIYWPVVDIQGAKSDAASTYTQKVGVALYITKGSELQRISAAHAAKIYEVFEGTRAVQWARGWAPPKVRKLRVAILRRLTQAEIERFWSERRSASSTGARQNRGEMPHTSSEGETQSDTFS